MIKKNFKFLIVILLAIILAIAGYYGFFSSSDYNYQIDLSQVEDVDIDIERFEQELFQLPRKNFINAAKNLKKEDPRIFTMYVERILGIGSVDKDQTYTKLKHFVFDDYWQMVYDTSQIAYEEVNFLEEELEDAFRHVRHYFPKDTIPEVYTLVKGIDLKYKSATYDNLLAISLDMYLGEDFKYYPSMYPDYLITSFRKPYMAPDAMKTYFSSKYPEDDYAKETLISKMIYQGKMLFFLDLTMPSVHDSLKIRYTQEQLNWARRYEQRVWKQLIDNEVIYETNEREINKYMSEGPFTNAGGFPEETPPRIAEWVGWQIVRKYKQQHPNQSVREIFNERDHQKILNLASYNP